MGSIFPLAGVYDYAKTGKRERRNAIFSPVYFRGLKGVIKLPTYQRSSLFWRDSEEDQTLVAILSLFEFLLGGSIGLCC
jgi:hypothetical protein